MNNIKLTFPNCCIFIDLDKVSRIHIHKIENSRSKVKIMYSNKNDYDEWETTDKEAERLNNFLYTKLGVT